MRIGFVGLGAMGRPMATNLARAGHALVVHDVNAAAAQEFVDANGGTAASSPADFASVEAIVTMLPTGQIVSDALVGDGGLALTLSPGTLAIDMSSSEPEGTRKLGEKLAARGLLLVDAPVSGGVPRAIEGTLAIMVGGEAEAVERAKPILASLGARIFETGALGSGHAMKALNNYVSATAYAATAEALLMGVKFGLDPSVMVDILNASTGRTFHSELVFKDQVIGERFAAGFALALAAKDVRIAAGMADGVEIDAPIVKLISQRMTAASDALGPSADVTEAIKSWGRLR